MKRSSLIIAFLLVALGLSACTGTPFHSINYLDGYTTFVDGGLVNVVIEIPAGTNDKWEVDKKNGALRWDRKDGKPRIIQYLAYPGNYGMIPRTSLPRELGGDGDPLDVLLLGSRIERGMVVQGRPIGILRLIDDGERDDKILAVPTSGPLSDVFDIGALESRYPGAQLIIKTWFINYKGRGRITSSGFGNAAAAMAVVLEASRYYGKSPRSRE